MSPAGPVYYCPPGVGRPQHIRHIAGARLVEGAGPDGQAGTVYGGTFNQDDVYQRTDAGWWVHLRGDSRDLLRNNCLPGLDVGGWLAPHILNSDGAPLVGYFAAGGFTVPEPLRPIVERLQSIRPEDRTAQPTMDLAQLAADLLAINFHVSIHELGLMQSLTPQMVCRIVYVAYPAPAVAVA